MTDQNSNEQQTCSAKDSPEAGWHGQPAGMAMNQQPTGESRYNFLVTGLMVIIVVALSALWLQERALRVKFQRQGVQLKKSLAEMQSRAMLARLGGGTRVDSAFVNKLEMLAAQSQEQDQKPQFEIIREELATVPMTVNGKSKQVLQLSETVGRRAGFIPGDLIYVTEPPAASSADK